MSSLLHPHSPFRIFITSSTLTVLALVLVYVYLGWQAMFVALMLMVIELTFSFDNAIINARVLMKMTPFWQRMFMTVGILIAVFGMRLVFPILIVMLSAGLGWNEVINLAVQNPERYSEVLHEAHPSIAAFGGMFLLMLALHFFFDPGKIIHWFTKLEKPMQIIGRKWLHAVVSSAVLLVIVLLPGNEHPQEVLMAGIFGIVTYLIVHGASELFTLQHERAKKRHHSQTARQVALAGLSSFIYLEVLDASFSLDGVIGAFAITKDVVLIAVGLGIGALWVRSLTLFIVRRKVLHTYRFLEHGAHYVIGILSFTLLLGIFFEIPEVVAGIIGIVVIVMSIISSRRAAKEDLEKLTS
jgi:uncharacterized protein